MDVGFVFHDRLPGRLAFGHFAVSFVNDVDDCALKVRVANDLVCFDLRFLTWSVWELTPTVFESDFVIAKPHVIPDVAKPKLESDLRAH